MAKDPLFLCSLWTLLLRRGLVRSLQSCKPGADYLTSVGIIIIMIILIIVIVYIYMYINCFSLLFVIYSLSSIVIMYIYIL